MPVLLTGVLYRTLSLHNYECVTQSLTFSITRLCIILEFLSWWAFFYTEFADANACCRNKIFSLSSYKLSVLLLILPIMYSTKWFENLIQIPSMGNVVYLTFNVFAFWNKIPPKPLSIIYMYMQYLYKYSIWTNSCHTTLNIAHF